MRLFYSEQKCGSNFAKCSWFLPNAVYIYWIGGFENNWESWQTFIIQLLTILWQRFVYFFALTVGPTITEEDEEWKCVVDPAWRTESQWDQVAGHLVQKIHCQLWSCQHTNRHSGPFKSGKTLLTIKAWSCLLSKCKLLTCLWN